MENFKDVLAQLKMITIDGVEYYYLTQVLKYSSLSRQTAEYQIKNDIGDISKFVIRIVHKSANGKERGKYLVLASAIGKICDFESPKPPQEDIDFFYTQYYKLIELIEASLEGDGASVATKTQKWLDMPIIDVEIIAEAFYIHKKEKDDEPSLETKNLIRNGISNHSFPSSEIFKICLTAVNNMIENIEG